MMDLFHNLLASAPFIPHGHCYLWKPGLVGLHIASDAIVAISYYSIPATLVYFVQKRKDLPFNWIFLLFGAFIILCGSTHLMEIWTLWHPNYWASGLLKAVTALVSVITALMLIPLVPKALALPSPAELEAANVALAAEVIERQKAEADIRTLNAELEERVKVRTQELSTTNLELKAEVAQRQQAETELQQAKDDLEIRVEERTKELKETVQQLQNEIWERQQAEKNLRAMQTQIIAQEKLASLGSLTAGIAHEIRNPLNFVNNFAELSTELTEELLTEFETQQERLDPETSDYIAELLNDLNKNVTKINEHGQRAARIVSNMLSHARGGIGEWSKVNINTLLAEAVNLAYHGMRGNNSLFNVAIESQYDDSIGQIDLVQQDINRALLNILTNACYATYEKQQDKGDEFSPAIYIETKNLEDSIKICIQDNGKGMEKEVVEKIFHPFFTTKPTGEGTGLGLSMTHDIIVQQHQGDIKVETAPGSYAKFIITLPKKSLAEVC